MISSYTPSLVLGMKVGKHGIIIEFTEPVSNTKRSATYLPEVPAHEGTNFLMIQT